VTGKSQSRLGFKSRFKAHLTSDAIRIWICDPDHHQNLIICSLAHCQPSLKISCKSLPKLLRLVANRQTNRQTNNNDYASSLVEVKSKPKSKENLNQHSTLTTARMCAYHCAQVLHTIQHTTVLIIFPLILQTITIAQTLYTAGGGEWSSGFHLPSFFEFQPHSKQCKMWLGLKMI